jgi:class 3 adenylate cyclase
VNVASRLERLVRTTDGDIAISEALALAVLEEAGPAAGGQLLAGFEPLPPRRLRGRAELVGVRILSETSAGPFREPDCAPERPAAAPVPTAVLQVTPPEPAPEAPA